MHSLTLKRAVFNNLLLLGSKYDWLLFGCQVNIGHILVVSFSESICRGETGMPSLAKKNKQKKKKHEQKWGE
jgi:hypothetical protein